MLLIEATLSFRWFVHVFDVFVSSSPEILRVDQGRAGPTGTSRPIATRNPVVAGECPQEVRLTNGRGVVPAGPCKRALWVIEDSESK